MLIKSRKAAYFVALSLSLVFVHLAAAADRDDESSGTNSTPRYGLFDWLDHRSQYTQEVFPEPFLVNDMAQEDTEFEFNYFHTKGRGQQTDTGFAEVQQGFGLLTFEAELPYEWKSGPSQTVEGIAPIELGARYPLYQFVSDNRFVDATFGPALEGGIPVHLALGRDAEFTPEIFNALVLGKHFTLTTVLGYEMLFGGKDENDGERSFEYGLSSGYLIRCGNSVPGVKQLIPMFEVVGERGLNRDEAGQNNVLCDAGFRIKFKKIGDLHPNVGLAYIFPIDKLARAELHEGVYASLILEF
jgi:hypothetical protein